MSQTIGSWVVALRIARREARTSKGRTALSAVMVGLPILAVTTVAILMTSLSPTPENFLRDHVGHGAQASVQSACPPVYQSPDIVGGGQMCRGDYESRSTSDLTALLRAHTPDHEVLTITSGFASIRSATESSTVQVRALDAASPVADTAQVIEGRLPGSPAEIALPRREAGSLGVSLGGTVTLADEATGIELTVVGLLPSVSDAVAPAATSLALTDTSTTWFLLGDAPVTWTDVLGLNELGFTALSWDVAAHPPAPGSTPFEQSSAHDSTPFVYSVVNLTVAAIGIGIIEVVMLVGPAFAVGARRQTRSLALLAAAGGDAATLRRVVLASGLTIGAVASTVAVILGLVIAAVIVTRPTYDPWDGYAQLTVPGYLPLFAVAGTLIAMAAAWLPARAAARLDVVRALAGRRSETRPRRRTAIAGLVGTAIGAGLIVTGIAVFALVLVSVGAVVLLLGAAMCSGLLTQIAGRLGKRSGPSMRLALRDLSRSRARSAPAIGAVLTATAVAAATGTFLSFQASTAYEGWAPAFGDGRVAVDVRPAWDASKGSTADRVALAEDVIAAAGAISPGARSAVLSQLVPATPPAGHTSLDLEHVKALECTWEVDGLPMTAGQAAADPRCADSPFSGTWNNITPYPGADRWTSLWVDDGAAMALLDVPGAPEAASALRAGNVVTATYAATGENGWVTLEATTEDDNGTTRTALGTARAAFIPSATTALLDAPAILPTAAAQRLSPDWTITPAIVVIAPGVPWGVDESMALRAAVPRVDVRIDLPPEPVPNDRSFVMAAIGALVAIGAVLVAAGLAAADQRADLVTLAAIGATPRTRRSVAGFHAASLGLLGTLPGLALGPILGTVLIKLAGESSQVPFWAERLEWPPWQLFVILLAGPLLAGILTATFTPSRLLPTQRRPVPTG